MLLVPKAKNLPKAKSSLSVGLCPCGSGRRFADCCGVYLSGGSQALGAPTPEALMRSRYSAYACGDDAYVLATWAPETRPSRLFEPGEARPKWMKLKVLGHSTAADGQSGEVHFRAVARTAHSKWKSIRIFAEMRKGIGSMFLVKCSAPEDEPQCGEPLDEVCR